MGSSGVTATSRSRSRVLSSAVATSPANTVSKTLHGVSHSTLEAKPYAVADHLLDWITSHPSSA
jgi:hypothetical protein